MKLRINEAPDANGFMTEKNKSRNSLNESYLNKMGEWAYKLANELGGFLKNVSDSDDELIVNSSLKCFDDTIDFLKKYGKKFSDR